MADPEIMNVPPVEAAEFFRKKGLHAGFDWRDTEAGEHLRSFTVAKAMDLDVLGAIRDEVQRAIDDGITFEAFEDSLKPQLVARGWWGRAEMIDPADPAGKAKIVQLGSHHRLKTIFDTNLSMAYARGRWERIERTAEARPWLMYVAVLDARTRPEHLRWHGTIRRWDDPFWRTHYPPCGWRCRCYVIQLSDADLKERGLSETRLPEGWDVTRPWHNVRTGETAQVPVGIDPGFQHNVGTIVTGADAADRLIEKIDAAGDELRRASVGEIARSRLFRQFLQRAARGSEHGDWAVAAAGGPVADALGARSATVRLSGETAAKQRRHHDELEAGDYAIVQRALDSGELFLEDNGRFVRAFVEDGGRPWKVVVKRTEDGSRLYLSTLHKATDYDLRVARRRFRRIERE